MAKQLASCAEITLSEAGESYPGKIRNFPSGGQGIHIKYVAVNLGTARAKGSDLGSCWGNDFLLNPLEQFIFEIAR